MEHLADSISSFECPDLARIISYGESLALTIGLNSLEEVSSVVARVVFYSLEGVIIAEWNSANLKNSHINLHPGVNTIQLPIGPLHLKRGSYSLGILIQNATTRENLVWSHQKHQIDMEGPSLGASCYVLP
jgi:hypothetical protein